MGVEVLRLVDLDESPRPAAAAHHAVDLATLARRHLVGEFKAAREVAVDAADRPPGGAAIGALVELLDPGLVVVVSGPDFWRHAERDLGLGLAPAPFPLIREGRAGGRTWLVGYHPGYARKAGARLHGPGTGTSAYYTEQARAAVERRGAAR